jgi:hypothetical protein
VCIRVFSSVPAQARFPIPSPRAGGEREKSKLHKKWDALPAFRPDILTLKLFNVHETIMSQLSTTKKPTVGFQALFFVMASIGATGG